MDYTSNSTFRQIADALGMQPKLLYSLQETAKVTGVPYETILEECRTGRLRCYLPPGRKQGRAIRPEWVDEWIEEGANNAR